MRAEIHRRLGHFATEIAGDGTWVDNKGHTRLTKLEPDGDYHTICDKRNSKREKANRDHARWRKRFMREARAH